jgi:hypothetical protein
MNHNTAQAMNSFVNLNQEVIKLRDERAELLQALRDVVGWVPSTGWHTNAPMECVERCMVLIRKSKGEQA